MIFKISYFYKIRFFKENQIPISTAKWDPLWFHNNSRDKTITFKDKNNVINGLRMECFAPGKECENLCNGKANCNEDHNNCNFLKKYSNQLKELEINDFFYRLDRLLKENNIEQTNDLEIIFIVYESPDNKCSERDAIKNYFIENGGIVLTEF